MSAKFARIFTGLLVLLGFGMIAPSATSAVEIQAHRGGSNVEGVATYPENSMSGFRHSLAEGFTIEFDLQVTSDGVPVVMHDEDLDRTTNCTGAVDVHTLADLAPCRIDQLGSGDEAEPIGPGDPLLEPVPTFTRVLALLRKTGGRATIEVKNLSGAHPDFVTEAYRQLQASGIPSSRVVVQNFKAYDLLPAPGLYPGVATSVLSLSFSNDSYVIQAAETNNFDWVSPQWPISADFMARARAADKKVVPFTIDDVQGMKDAAALGVDALITNDPTMADRLVGPRSKISLALLPGKTRARPGRTIRLRVRISNRGEGQTGPVQAGLTFNRRSLIPVRAARRSFRTIEPGQSKIVTFAIRVRPGARKFGRFPVTFRVKEQDGGKITKVRAVRVLRP